LEEMRRATRQTNRRYYLTVDYRNIMDNHEDHLKIKPIHTKEYEVKQSKYHQCGHLPIRSIILGPSGSGKTVLLQNTILNSYNFLPMSRRTKSAEN
jgi:hypothetical protein